MAKRCRSLRRLPLSVERDEIDDEAREGMADGRARENPAVSHEEVTTHVPRRCRLTHLPRFEGNNTLAERSSHRVDDGDLQPVLSPTVAFDDIKHKVEDAIQKKVTPPTLTEELSTAVLPPCGELHWRDRHQRALEQIAKAGARSVGRSYFQVPRQT